MEYRIAPRYEGIDHDKLFWTIESKDNELETWGSWPFRTSDRSKAFFKIGKELEPNDKFIRNREGL